MRTPYDAALRALDREMDELKALVAAATDELDRVQTLHEALDAQIARERQWGQGEWSLFAEAYLVRARAERTRLSQLRQDAEVELTLLRRKAAQQYASIRAVGGAADQFRADADAAFARAERVLLDDTTATRFVQRRRAQRRAELS